MAFNGLARLSLLAILHTVVSSFELAGPRLVGIPTIPFNASANGETYDVSAIQSIIVDQAYADLVDESGETLIPPTLTQFGSIFAADVSEIWNLDKINQTEGEAAQPNSIFLTIDETPSYQYVSGEASSEGYTLEVTTSGIVIRGASPLGVWWGTRTLIQLALLSNGELPLGTSVDVPGWKIRGMMLDDGRHFYPSEFITELCAYMSFFKQNTLHLHISDNLINSGSYTREQSLSLYARFRLWSEAEEVKGLNNFKNESYTKDDFKAMQQACAARGVTIIPEIESPGHALPIVQWKPELGLSTDLSLLNISHPDTIPSVKTIWSTFFDWFDSKTVHIGADEYTGPVDDYNLFVNELADFIQTNGSKSVRIWGTFPPKPNYDNITTTVSVQHWEFFEDNPLFDYIKNNYTTVNSDDTFYVVNKYSGSYPQSVPIAKTFTGDPATGGLWQPNIFDTKNKTNNPERSNPLIPGAIAPLWNDYGPNTSVYSEAYYAWRDGIPALADKQWGGNLSMAEFETAYSVLQPSAPGQNLERKIPSKTSLILQYAADSWTSTPEDGKILVADLSDNGLDGVTNCPLGSDNTIQITPNCSIDTPISSKGRNYTLALRLFINSTSENDATLISGHDSALMLTPNITLFASGNYYRLNSTLPLQTWVDLNIVGRGARTFASVKEVSVDDPFCENTVTAQGDGVEEEEFLARIGVNGRSLVWAPIAIEAPVAEIGQGGWNGAFAGVILSSET
ncbi:beta-hexosaminidase [Nemania sp. FL0916]|nr:beta-hexosaminidase [Nemania sp. FL0916]